MWNGLETISYLRQKILNMVSEEMEKVCQTCWCQDNIAGLNYRQKEQHSPAGLLRGALYENFRDFKWLYICLKQLETE